MPFPRSLDNPNFFGGNHMNNGGYGTKDFATLGPKVEEIVRADLGSATPIPYTIEPGEGAGPGAKSLLGNVASQVFSGKTEWLATVYFELAQPRPVTLQVHLIARGVGAALGTTFYQTPLAKPVAGTASLGGPRAFFRGPIFEGDPALCERLNANGELRKRAHKFARAECQNLMLEAPRVFEVEPGGGSGAVLVAASLPRSYMVGTKVSLDVQEFIDLAALVETTI